MLGKKFKETWNLVKWTLSEQTAFPHKNYHQLYFSETEQRRENMEGNCRYNNNLVGPIKCPIEEINQILQIFLQIVLPNNQEILNVLKDADKMSNCQF